MSGLSPIETAGGARCPICGTRYYGVHHCGEPLPPDTARPVLHSMFQAYEATLRARYFAERRVARLHMTLRFGEDPAWQVDASESRRGATEEDAGT